MSVSRRRSLRLGEVDGLPVRRSRTGASAWRGCDQNLAFRTASPAAKSLAQDPTTQADRSCVAGTTSVGASTGRSRCATRPYRTPPDPAGSRRTGRRAHRRRSAAPRLCRDRADLAQCATAASSSGDRRTVRRRPIAAGHPGHRRRIPSPARRDRHHRQPGAGGGPEEAAPTAGGHLRRARWRRLGRPDTRVSSAGTSTACDDGGVSVVHQLYGVGCDRIDFAGPGRTGHDEDLPIPRPGAIEFGENQTHPRGDAGRGFEADVDPDRFAGRAGVDRRQFHRSATAADERPPLQPECVPRRRAPPPPPAAARAVQLHSPRPQAVALAGSRARTRSRCPTPQYPAAMDRR